MSVHAKTTWILVGDGARAQVYSLHAVPLRLTKVPSGTIKATRDITHGPAHMSEARGIAHIGNQHGDHQRHEDVFVEHLATTLDTAARDGEFDDIVVVLPPKALAHFRRVVRPTLQSRIKREIVGDWTRLELPDLERHLAAELP